MSTSSRFHQLRDDIEYKFSLWGRVCYRHPLKIIVSVMLLMAYVSSFLPNIQVDTSTAGFLHAADPVRITYDKFQREFSRDEKALVIVEGDVFSADFLHRLQALHEDLAAIDMVTKVDSLSNARLVYGDDDELIIEDLLEAFPDSPAQMDVVKQRVMDNPVYKLRFINEGLNLTCIVITTDNFSKASMGKMPLSERDFISGEEVGVIVDRIDQIIQQHNAPGFSISAGGSPHMMHLLTVIMGQDMLLFSSLGILTISIILALLYKRWVMVLLPVTVSMLATFFTIALMVFFNVVVTTSIQILPSFLLAVGVGNSVHVFTAFFQGMDKGLAKEDALSYALGHSGLAVTMTGLTTAGGLLSFISAEIKPVSDFGFVTPLGILCALFFSLVLLPALIAIVPIKNKALQDDSHSWYQRFLRRCAQVSTASPKKVIGFWVLLLLPALYFVSQISLSHTPLYWFPKDNDFRIATLKIDEQLGGTASIEVIIDTGKSDGVKDPLLLKKMQAASAFALTVEHEGLRVGKVISLVDIAKELNQSLHGNDPAYYSIPENKQLLAQEFLLYELSGDEDMQQIVNEDFSKTRMTFLVPLADAVIFPPFLDKFEAGIEEILVNDSTQITFTGVFIMMARTVVAMLKSTAMAYVFAICIITPLMMFLVGSIRLGLLSMIPNLIPIILTMGLMQILGINLDAFTLLIGSIALGLAVDDTIHFMHNYRRYNAQFNNSEKAVFETLRTTGQALFFTSMVLAVGFFINVFATMTNLHAFGLLTAFCIIMAFLADVTLAPAIMTLEDKRLRAKQP